MTELRYSRAITSGGTVLAVDDQPDNLALLEDILADEGFTVRLACDGHEALTEVQKETPDCIVLDIMMPRLDGFETCRRLKEQRETHFTPVVMLTALTSVDDKVRAFEMGADDFLNKPINVQEVTARVCSMVRIKRLRDELDSSEDIILSMVEALESRDARAAGHSRRVAAGAIILAQKLDLPQDRVELIAKGAILHDIGRIGISSELLIPITERTPQQQADFEQHTILGERILAPFLSFSRVRALVRHHHERLDGSGFPDGIGGGDLGLEIEILALTNHFDELCTQVDDPEAVAEQLRAEAGGGAFHQDLVETLLSEVAPATLREMAPRWQDLLPFPATVGPGRIVVGYGTPATRVALDRILSGAGHEVIGLENGEQVIEAVKDHKPDLLLLDVDLPAVNGLELAANLKSRPETEFLPVVLVTAQNELGMRNYGAQVGADDFLFLPINRMELVARVKSLLRLRSFFKDLEEHQSVILSLASALEAKDSYTRGHSERVGILAAKVGRALGLDAVGCQVLRTAGQIHDVGKIGMPERLLNKHGKLSPEEFEIVMHHPVVSERICQPLKTLKPVLPLVRHHHERFDGSGYPDGLTGEEIPLGARVLGLVDAYDALTSARSYRSNYSPAEAVEVLERETRADRWDPTVFSALTSVVLRS